MTLIVFNKLTAEQVIEVAYKSEQVFIANPHKKVARNDLFSVRRGHIMEDTLKHAEDNVAEPLKGTI